MYVFEVWINGEDYKHIEIAETHGKAKYQYYQYLQDGLWEAPFGEIVKHLRCKKIGAADVTYLFEDKEQFERICKGRGISFAYQGMKIEVAGKIGVIVGGNHSCNLNVVFEGEWIPSNCHPWWETRYFDREGNVVADYRKVKENESNQDVVV